MSVPGDVGIDALPYGAPHHQLPLEEGRYKETQEVAQANIPTFEQQDCLLYTSDAADE